MINYNNAVYKVKQNKFKAEICRKHCKLCDAVKPDLCLFFLENLGMDFFRYIMTPIIIMREKYPRIVIKFKTFEGFVALFCRPDVCKFTDNRHCDSYEMKRCYSLFRKQAQAEVVHTDYSMLRPELDSVLHEELKQALNHVDGLINNLPNKKRKKLFKNAIRTLKSIFGTYPIQKHPPKVKKEVTTSLFYNNNEIWVNRINEILGSANAVENIDRQ